MASTSFIPISVSIPISISMPVLFSTPPSVSIPLLRFPITVSITPSISTVSITPPFFLLV